MVRLAAPADGVERLRSVPGVESFAVDGAVVRLEVHGSMDLLVKELATLPVQTLTSEPPELDEIFPAATAAMTFAGQRLASALAVAGQSTR